MKPFFPLLFFVGLVGIHPAGVYAEERTKQADRPNILLILIDDMSWSGPSCYGNKLVDTPNIDRLASRGMKFTSAYVTPSCSPTRTELLSGRHSARMHITRALPGGLRNIRGRGIKGLSFPGAFLSAPAHWPRRLRIKATEPPTLGNGTLA